jgi:hypothetical protein
MKIIADTPYDAYEISLVTQHQYGDGAILCTRVENGEELPPEDEYGFTGLIWTLYGHVFGEAQEIANFETQEEAFIMLSRILGRPVTFDPVNRVHIEVVCPS